MPRVNPDQLESALINLCINARDAMSQGGRMTIETANKWLDERTAGTGKCRPGNTSRSPSPTRARDNSGHHSACFDPFFTTKPIGEGTGLGLTMVHGFIRQSGGQARVYSELGKGTTVHSLSAPKLQRGGPNSSAK